MEDTGIRILIYSIEMMAAKLGKIIKVLLSISSDFYVRIYFQVIES